MESLVQGADERYSDIFHGLQDKQYYSIPNNELGLSRIKLSTAPKSNIYAMRTFKDDALAKLHAGDLTEHQTYYAQHGYLILRNFILPI